MSHPHRLGILLLASLGLFTGCSNYSSGPATVVDLPPSGISLSNVVTYHNDLSRSGVQPNEQVLTPTNVTQATFGKLFSYPVDGQVYAEPLLVSAVKLADGSTHNILFVATEHDSVYAFDADSASTTPLWTVSLLGPGELTVTSGDVGVKDISPEIGITSTPVIDPVAGVIYVVTKSKSTSNFIQRVHALKLVDGTETMNGPTVIAATVGAFSFDPLRNNQRSALALINGTVWIAWASHGDKGSYHGWMIGYNGTDLSKQAAAFNVTQTNERGGIWMSGNGPSADSSGNIYIGTGNGQTDIYTNDFSCAALKLQLQNGLVNIADYFIPYNEYELTQGDLDFGTIGSLLLPDQPGANPHLLVTGDKSGAIYLINRDAMGGESQGTNANLQTFQLGYQLFSNPVFFNNTLYIVGRLGPMMAYTFDPSTGLFNTSPSSQSPNSFTCTNCYVAAASPAVSSNQGTNAIVWVLDNGGYAVPSPAVLYAYDASDLSKELWDSNQAAALRDQAGNAVKFATPTIANGKVYVGNDGSVTVYGLLSQTGTKASGGRASF